MPPATVPWHLLVTAVEPFSLIKISYVFIETILALLPITSQRPTTEVEGLTTAPTEKRLPGRILQWPVKPAKGFLLLTFG